MKVKRVKTGEFRRFNNLIIEDIPEMARLVILAGPNGNGKSSLFDAMMKSWERSAGHGGSGDHTYYGRIGSPNAHSAYQTPIVEFHGQVVGDHRAWRKTIYFRSAYRNEAEMQIQRFERMTSAVDERRFTRLIENDAAVGSNYKRLVSNALEDVYEREDSGTTIGAFREASIGRVRSAVLEVFPHLRLDSLGNPMEVGEFKFTKGTQTGYSYKNLSGGEKAVFDILLDLAIKSREFDDTVFCIDEPEAHLNPRVHGALLDAMLSLISPSSQLWIATHAIGMLRRARDIAREAPGSVAILDFDADFDQSQVLRPVRMDRAFWQKSLEVAVDDLASLVAPACIIACESSLPDGKPGEGHDAAIYNRIFASEFPDARFVSIGSVTEQKGDRFAVLQALSKARPSCVCVTVTACRIMRSPKHSRKGFASFRRETLRVTCSPTIPSTSFATA
jgi:predicted ATPase